MSKSKRLQADWKSAQEAALHQQFDLQLTELSSSLQKKKEELESVKSFIESSRRQLEREKRDVEDLLQRQQDRKEELAKVNEELRQQIRLIEAKAKPDSLWIQAFSSGYEKAWEMMSPIMLEGVQKIRETLKQEALASALSTVEPAVQQRVEERIQDVRKLRTFAELTAKRGEFQRKQQAASGTDQSRYDHYLEVINWMLNGSPTAT